MPFNTNLSNTSASTPSVTSGQLTNPNVFQSLGFGRATQPTPAPYPGQVAPVVKPTPTGGVSFSPAAAAAYKAPTQTPAPAPQPAGLAQYVTNTNSTPNGGSLTTDANGQPAGYTASSGFSINPTGAVPSDALTSYADPGQTHSQYSDYVNALAQAQGYSPSYVNAQTDVYNAQAQGAQLGVNAANIQNELLNGGPDIPGGATTDYLSGITAKALAQNTLQQSVNTQQQTGANIALNAQQLQRTGNIAAAQTQLQYSPTGISGADAINQVNTLSTQYPGAGIPPFDPSQDPLMQAQNARNLVAQSGAYQAGFQSTYTTPGGGTGIYSKLNVQGLQQNPDGTIALVPAAAAALGAAQAGVINTNLAGLSSINAAVDSSSKTLATTKAFMNQYGINDSSQPLVNQVQNAINAKTAPAASLAAFQNDLTALRSDYSQYLVARGGSIAGSGPDSPEVLNALPPNVSYSGIEQIVGQMQAVGNNTASALNTQIQQAMSGLQSGTVQSTSGGSSAGGSSNPFSPSSFVIPLH